MKIGAIAVLAIASRKVKSECYPGVYSDSYSDCSESYVYDEETTVIETTTKQTKVRKFFVCLFQVKIVIFGVSSK